MTRELNALRQHLVADIDKNNPTQVPNDDKFFPLEKYIKSIEDESDEETEDEAFYDGDGTPEETVNSVVVGYAVEGYYDPADKAQALIVSKKYKTGEGRRLWHRVIQSDGKVQHTQIANLTGIKNGGGEASEYEQFEVTLKWIKTPIEEKLPKTPLA